MTEEDQMMRAIALSLGEDIHVAMSTAQQEPREPGKQEPKQKQVSDFTCFQETILFYHL